MVLILKPNSFFVFDLDDTLYPEIEYLLSAYKEIAEKIKVISGDLIYDEMVKKYQSGENVFDWLISTYQKKNDEISISNLLKTYREHLPNISINNETRNFLEALKALNIPMGCITDGRSITQRNKIKALGLGNYFTDIIISEEFGSEKPNEKNYLYFEEKYSGKKFYFIGDNTSKDFIVPLKLNWFTICLKNKGGNIHSQNLEDGILPDLIIDSFEELILI